MHFCENTPKQPFHCPHSSVLVVLILLEATSLSRFESKQGTHGPFFFIFFYNLNQQSEFTFYKLMLWLLQCLDGESSSSESPVPEIRSIGQFLLSRLFSSPNSSVLMSGFSWVPSLNTDFWRRSSLPASECQDKLLHKWVVNTMLLNKENKEWT
jgi:hypothetical protein